jgi:hypothetical protein
MGTGIGFFESLLVVVHTPLPWFFFFFFLLSTGALHLFSFPFVLFFLQFSLNQIKEEEKRNNDERAEQNQ